MLQSILSPQPQKAKEEKSDDSSADAKVGTDDKNKEKTDSVGESYVHTHTNTHTSTHQHTHSVTLEDMEAFFVEGSPGMQTMHYLQKLEVRCMIFASVCLCFSLLEFVSLCCGYCSFGVVHV